MSDTASTETASAPQVSLHHPGGELTLRTVPASEGAPGLDVSKLLATTGQVALDIGFVNTASCTSAITYIDGDAGILRYRGYPIDQLAGKASFVEVSYLLIYGELPTADQLAEFDARLRRHPLRHEGLKHFSNGPRPHATPPAARLAEFAARLRRHTLLHEDLKQFFNGFPRDAHPMPVLSSAVSALSTFYQDSLDPFDERHVEISTVRLLAKLPTIAACGDKKAA